MEETMADWNKDPKFIKCPICNGKRLIGGVECRNCGGRGYVKNKCDHPEPSRTTKHPAAKH